VSVADSVPENSLDSRKNTVSEGGRGMMAKAEQVHAAKKAPAAGTFAAARERRPQATREVKGPITLDVLYSCMQAQTREIADLKDSMRTLTTIVEAGGVIVSETGMHGSNISGSNNNNNSRSGSSSSSSSGSSSSTDITPVENFTATSRSPAARRPIQRAATGATGNSAVDNHNLAIEQVCMV
jgi:hypothetical protein